MTKKDIIAHVLRGLDAENVEDRKEFRRLASLVRQSKWKDAKKYLRGMDTFNREAVSDEVSNELNIRGAGSKRIVEASVCIKDCKKVFKEGFRPGAVYRVELEFPGDITDDQLSMAVVCNEEAIIDNAIEILYEDKGKVKV